MKPTPTTSTSLLKFKLDLKYALLRTLSKTDKLCRECQEVKHAFWKPCCAFCQPGEGLVK